MGEVDANQTIDCQRGGGRVKWLQPCDHILLSQNMPRPNAKRPGGYQGVSP